MSVAVASPTARTRPLRHGLALGPAFAVLYMIGMQEIMVDTSPFAAWGSAYVTYQAIIGLGDAIPVIILCAVVGALLAGGRTLAGGGQRRDLVALLVMTLTVGTVRWVVSALGVIQSGIAEYPVAVVAWGYPLGLGFGIGYVLLTRTNLTPAPRAAGAVGRAGGAEVAGPAAYAAHSSHTTSACASTSAVACSVLSGG